jgi:cyclohexadienyl dehydratase
MLVSFAPDINRAMRASLLAAVAVACLGMAAHAQTGGTASLLDIVMQRGTLQVCTTGDYKPFTFHKVEADAYEGIDIEMAKSLASAIGAEPHFVRTK